MSVDRVHKLELAFYFFQFVSILFITEENTASSVLASIRPNGYSATATTLQIEVNTVITINYLLK